ncbi:hypothetical protein [Citricoccus sp. I39-566]|uniref:hypothetical protein n=1 Tax=Citricoccus sp. I39-566 TaxID=3073268 RepID=UPI00286D34B8|nr:hypothetical protein [Citricoccus sp. I39-566]WMY78051.1 hypothetical protein RE421_14675 [Citricoccus sp. I39-566]
MHEGIGLVTVTARALEDFEIPTDATASWEFDFPTAEPQSEAPEFSDNLSGNPYYAQVRWMASNGISTRGECRR